MMKALPKTLKKLIADHPDQFSEGWTEQDSFGRDGGWSHWLYLKPGWINTATETHLIHEPTVREVLSMYRAVKPCDCEDCQAEKKRLS